MGKSILVVVAHPDDEVLGCGATIAKHAKAGDSVHVVILVEGATSRDDRRDRLLRDEELSGLARAARSAKDILGAASLELHDFPDNRMDSVDLLDIVKLIEKYVIAFEPEIVYTHHAGDVNIDHRRIHEAVIAACRPLPSQTVQTLLFFEIASSTEWRPAISATPFLPDWYVDVSETLIDKMAALDAYRTEMRPWPHPRSLEAVEHLARWRGASVGVQAAEAFALGRHLVK